MSAASSTPSNSGPQPSGSYLGLLRHNRDFRLVYLATPLSVLHFLWLDRDFITTPLIYAGIVGLLLVLRLPGVRHTLRIK